MKSIRKVAASTVSFLSDGTLLICACLSLALAGFVSADARADNNKDRVLTVMTRNMDNGTDFGLIFAAHSQSDLVIATGATYAEIQASNIPERAAAVANEIAATNPDLVGLQEVYTYWVGPFGGPATTQTYNALQSLLDALAQRGLHYAAVAVLTNLDVEVPAFDPTVGLFDVRASDSNVVLARTDLPVSQLKLSNIQAQHFATNSIFTNPVLGTLEIPGGWIAVDGKKRGKSFRFVTTHLDPVSTQVRAAQAEELLAGPADTTLPVILAGDLNSDAQSGNPAQNEAYRLLVGAGYDDIWSAVHPGDPGFTWPLHGEDPFTPFATPFERIDLVLTDGPVHPMTVRLVGNQLADLTPSGLWPSDHAGVVAEVVLEP
jgi:endonuclease/exonuclease/phosphatase family metal-dependent hydrolase